VQGKKILNWKGLKALGIVYSKTQITRKEKDQTFPRSFKLDIHKNSPRVWWEHEVIAWIEARAATIVV
jgi:predicted DNA-binding transcriptional regulator AlpA